jgi:hypothetical protein
MITKMKLLKKRMMKKMKKEKKMLLKKIRKKKNDFIYNKIYILF